MCMNSAGSFHCLCRQGYMWHPEINGCVGECYTQSVVTEHERVE